MGVFVPKDMAIDVLRAITDSWKEDLRYRVSRVKARLKFMIDDIGPEGMRELVEARLGQTLDDYMLPPAPEPKDHLGVHAQKQPGLVYLGVPVHLGLISGDQMVAVADLADQVGGDIRVTRQQNFILANVTEARVDEVIERLGEVGFPLDANPVRGHSIGCTGEPHCNFSVTETKGRLGALIEHLEARFGREIAPLRLHLDGCPHSCAQHWVGDLGFQGTTARDDDGKRRPAYDIFVRGGLGRDAAIAKPLFRRVLTEDLNQAVERIVGGWIEQREPDESFTAFTRRLTDDELGVVAGISPAKGRARDEEGEE
jgi:ferredoxin-nitrite reductase